HFSTHLARLNGNSSGAGCYARRPAGGHTGEPGPDCWGGGSVSAYLAVVRWLTLMRAGTGHMGWWFMALIDWFDRVYVISLASRTDRRKQMAAMLARAGVEICAGVVEFFDAVRSDAADGFPSPGARGCFLSHLAVLRRAKRS